MSTTGRVEAQRKFFETGATKDIRFRLKQLNILRNAIREREPVLMEALREDLNKSPFEAYATEIGFILDEIRFTMKHLSGWARPKRVPTPLVHFPSVSRIHSEPYGIALVMSPWNYPFQLAMAPLAGSMAAGNCTVLKPSEYSFYMSEALESLIGNYFDPAYITVIRGGREANKTLLDEAFDYIFFTGSVSVGKTVMEAAARHLTPVSLELGGKSPCIVDETAHIGLAGKRIAWGKFLNAGQTCVAPDYLLVHESVKDRLVNAIQDSIHQFYGANPCGNPEYPKIINDKHFARLIKLMKSGNALIGGTYDAKSRRITPTVMDDVTWDSAVMQEEIFGPVLPILTFSSLDEAIATVNSQPKPLALYLFTADRQREKAVLRNISFGGGCVNDCVVHLATPHMPFGGVGGSGMGGYHGKASFDTFSHKKSILKKSTLLDVSLRYPPYKNHLSLVKRIMR